MNSVEKDLTMRKQELVTEFKNYLENQRDEIEESYWMYLGIMLEIRSSSVSKKQHDLVEKNVDQLIAIEEQQFADNIVDNVGEDKIFDRRRSDQKILMNYYEEFPIDEIYGQLSTDNIKETAHEEVVERLVSDTGQSQENLEKYANDQFLGDLGQINEITYDSIIEHFNSAKTVEENNEDFQQIMSQYDNADFIVVLNGGNLPNDYHDLPSVALAYADKNGLIDDNIDELMDSPEARFDFSNDEDWQMDNNPDRQFDTLIYKQWLMEQDISRLVAYAFSNEGPVVMTNNEIFDFYTR